MQVFDKAEEMAEQFRKKVYDASTVYDQQINAYESSLPPAPGIVNMGAYAVRCVTMCLTCCLPCL